MLISQHKSSPTTVSKEKTYYAIKFDPCFAGWPYL